MSDARDPLRLMDAEHVDPALRAALRQVSRAEPGAAEVAALVERVAGALGGSAGGASWFSQFVAHGGGFKLMALLVAGGASVWGAVKMVPLAARPELATVSTHELAPASPAPQVEPLSTRADDHAVRAPAELREGAAPDVLEIAPGGSRAAALSQSAPTHARAGARGKRAGSAALAQSAPGSGVQRAAVSSSARPQAEVTPRAQERESEGEESELALITRAQSALKLAPRRALDLLDRHDTLYPTGHFAEEREVLWIDALSQLGMRRALASRGQRFLASYPSSIHCARVRSLLEVRPPSR